MVVWAVMGTSSLPKLFAIVGPTAAGKTDCAIRLARQSNGEVVSADSRQLYRGFVIGAGVVPGHHEVRDGHEFWVAEGIPHHLIGAIDPEKTFTVAEYKIAAEKCIDDILAHGKTPILCGGTGLYVSAIVDNFVMPEVAPDHAYRKQLESRTTEDIFTELKEKDPEYASRITPSNRRYITRALEVMHVTDEPFSRLQKKGKPKYDVEFIGITRDKEDLQQRIAARVEQQIKDGLVQEVQMLSSQFGWDVPAMSGLGYRQLKPYVDILSSHAHTDAEKNAVLIECKVKIIRETTQFAKRQLTWFKRDQRIVWHNLSHK